MSQKSNAIRIGKKRPRITGVLLAPLALTVWCIGWGLLQIREAKVKVKPKLMAGTEAAARGIILTKTNLDFGLGSAVKVQEKKSL